MNLKQFGILTTIAFFTLTALAAPVRAQAGATDGTDRVTLRMLVWEGYVPKVARQEFKSRMKEKYKTDVRFELEYVSDPNDFFTAIRAKEVDLISPAHDLIKDPQFSFIEKGLVLPLDLNNIPNYKSILPVLQKASHITTRGVVYGVPIDYGPYGLGYNSSVGEEPDSWGVFWDPAFAGKYTVSKDYYQCNIYIAALALGYSHEDFSSYDKMNTPELREKLVQLAANARSLWTGQDTADDLQGLKIATGWGTSFAELRTRGEIWTWAKPKEGVTGYIDNFVMGYALKDKPFHRKIGEEWLNFAISPWYQVNVIIRAGMGPVNLEIGHLLTQEEKKAIHFDQHDYFENNYILWPTFSNERDRNGMQLLWDEAVKAAK